MTKILIIEDDPLMLRMYERVFKLNNYDVEMAFDGEDGISKLKTAEIKPNIILLDIMMPKMSGFDALKIIKADDNFKDIPVIILTNLAGKEEADKGLKLGAISYLIKSEHEPKEIVSIIKENLEKLGKK
ncbi:MAG: Response regulator receiver protein [Parcubacteria group bacterium GW2011_GWF2_38_76]|nr:MAG: Response regulator receiver protein [Parcubacteria group bacterium GW2011_GWF2_38_76]HBM45701.1 response regulator [Patescibacteria group bacterium]